MSKDLLFELGTEDIPPGDLPSIAQNFRKDLEVKLEETRLDFGRTELFYTPRRLAVRVNELQEEQEDRIEVHRGPPEGIGLDREGNYTVAAKKFAEGHEASPEDLYLEETEDGTYFFVEESIEGKKASELLPELLTVLVKELEQPEKMRWNGSGLRFIRPIRWVVCLLGDRVLDLVLGEVESSRETRGHRFYGQSRFELKTSSGYEEALEENYVIPDPTERRERLVTQLTEKTAELGVEKATGEDFIDLLANSLEYPSLVSGNFPREYLDLPPELLFKTLTGEARLVPLVDSSGEPVASFIGFRDGSTEESEGVKRGYESVIHARLRDSKFFFSHDRERPLEDYVDDLKTVTFQEKLGSIWDKVERMRKLADSMAAKLEGFDPELCDRAVLLCKADLVTEVVDEFPSLEGTIGAYYAEMDGEPKAVVEGIREHYRPRSSTDHPPTSPTGVAASVSDKLDTLYGSFLIGEKPTGTRDPYGLRRKTDGIVRTLIDREVSLTLSEVIELAGSLYQFDGEDKAGEELQDYFAERLGRVLERTYELPYDVVDAVNIGQGLDFYDTYLKATALRECKEKEEMKDLVDSFTRVVNITEGQEEGDFSPDIFQLEEERILWQDLQSREDRLEALRDQRSYRELIQELLQLKEPIDDYFDNVMVMAEEEKRRENRLNFLLYLRRQFLKLGDLSRIVTE